MFVVSNVSNGTRVRHISIDNEEKEKFETYEQAHQVFESMEKGLKKNYRIKPIECERCDGNDDLTIIHVNDESKACCQKCLVEMFTKKNPVGRPSVGVTKKVSLTLSEEDWKWIDEQAEGNRSKLLRYLIGQEQSSESRWSNNACLGYAILGAEKLGYKDEQIKELMRAVYGEFDWKSVDEAKDVYNKSSY